MDAAAGGKSACVILLAKEYIHSSGDKEVRWYYNGADPFLKLMFETNGVSGKQGGPNSSFMAASFASLDPSKQTPQSMYCNY